MPISLLENVVAATLKLKQLREKNKGELLQQLHTLKAELAQLRVAKVTGGAANKLGKIHTVRKAIAQVNTVYNQTLRADVRKVQKERGFRTPLDLRPNLTRAQRLRLTPTQAAAMTLRQKKKVRHNPARLYALKN
jgi:large subunit ribosomal protein L35e